ncbi:Mitochondrial carrier protein [uncultured virus]|nr:Mitochondrial carrier protein [uncultured virus]
MNTKEKYFSGCLTGIISTCIFHPIDSLKTRLFYEKNNIGSVKSFYNGLTFNVLTCCFKSMLTFPTQEYFKDKLIEQKFSIYSSELYASICSGLLVGFFSTPINVIKLPLQSDPNKNKIFNIIQINYKNYGLKGFYRGGVGTLLRDVTWNAIYFPLFKYLNENHIDNKILSSISAGSIAMTISYPFDGIRMYRQNNNKNYNFWYGFSKALNFSSPNFKCYTISLLRVPTSMTLSHICYLYINDYLIKNKKS